MDFLISGTCQKVLFENGDFLNGECIKSIVAKLLGYIILLGSIGVKLPQILNIIFASSVEGLSATSFYMEVPLTITHVVYNHLQGNPFSSYGDAVMILIQNTVLVLLLWQYSKPRVSFSTIVLVSAMFVVVAAISLSLPTHLQPILPLCNIPLTLSSRIPQIIKNFQSRSTGSLSSITNFLILAGSLARIFTTIQEIGMDYSLLANYAVGALTTGTLFVQIIVYSSTTKAPIAKATKTE